MSTPLIPGRQWFSSRIGETIRLKISGFITVRKEYSSYDYSEVSVYDHVLKEVIENLAETDPRYNSLLDPNPHFPGVRL